MTPKALETLALWAMLGGFGPSFHMVLGPRCGTGPAVFDCFIGASKLLEAAMVLNGTASPGVCRISV